MDISLDATEVKLLGDRLAKAGLAVQVKGFQVLRKTALDIQRTAQSLAPVRTGALRSSITVEFGGSITGGTATATVGPTVNYAGYVEEGTSRMAPQPYMRPAVDAHEAQFLAALDFLTAEM